jgi:hypothetical protein
VDGGTLWVAFEGGSNVWSQTLNKTVGLMGMDLNTHQITSGQFGWACAGLDSDNVAGGPLSLTRWRDSIVYAHPILGFGVFPTTTASSSINAIKWNKPDYIPPRDGASRYPNFRCVEYADDAFYFIWHWRVVTTWSPVDGKMSFLFNCAQDITELNLPEQFKTITSIWLNREEGKLYAICFPKHNPNIGLAYDLKTQAWERLPEVPQKPPVPAPVLEQNAAAQAFREAVDEPVFGIALIDKTTFYVLTGQDADWRLEKVRINHE